MTLQCEWGQPALRRFGGDKGAVVLVDVLSFSTSVDVALSRGASVIPYEDWMEPIAAFARDRSALSTGPRGAAGFTVSPSSLLSLERGARLVLPTSHVSRLRLKVPQARVLAACFRNRAAVARALEDIDGDIAIVPVGELWPDDGGWRFALEDWLCAGALLETLGGRVDGEGRAALVAWRDRRGELLEALRDSRSGRRLVREGSDEDLGLAAELDVSETVPILRDGRFVDAGTGSGPQPVPSS